VPCCLLAIASSCGWASGSLFHNHHLARYEIVKEIHNYLLINTMQQQAAAAQSAPEQRQASAWRGGAAAGAAGGTVAAGGGGGARPRGASPRRGGVGG
jgi:uncharacterized membrane protein